MSRRHNSSHAVYGSGALDAVEPSVWSAFPAWLGQRWEAMVRSRVARSPVRGERFRNGARWWGRGLDGTPLELDLVAESVAREGVVLVGEAKLALEPSEVPQELARLTEKA